LRTFQARSDTRRQATKGSFFGATFFLLLVLLTTIGEIASLYAASNDPYSSSDDFAVPVGSVFIFLLLACSFLVAAWAVRKRRYRLAAMLSTSGSVLAALATAALIFEAFNGYVMCSVLGACPNWRNYAVVGVILSVCAALGSLAAIVTFFAGRKR
jgi:ABC-type multidrug transport system fused ATPase/permease subunit